MKDKTASGIAAVIFAISVLVSLAVTGVLIWGIVELVSWVVTK